MFRRLEAPQSLRDSSPKWEQAHPQALRSARKLCRHAKGSPFGRAGIEQREMTERARTLAVLRKALPEMIRPPLPRSGTSLCRHIICSAGTTSLRKHIILDITPTPVDTFPSVSGGFCGPFQRQIVNFYLPA